MSWLLMTATPALLMLAAIGLDRIETGLKIAAGLRAESAGSPASTG